MFGNDKRWPAAAMAGGLIALAALVGCKREPSVASKSAVAFREAQKKGETFEGAAQGHGHGAMTPGDGHEMPGTTPESGSAAGHSGGMDHSRMAMGSANPSADPTAVVASPGEPARTLRPDPLDSPAMTSVADAQRSAAMAEEMKGMGGHGGHGAGTYRQIDAGRGPGAYEGSEKQTSGAEPHQHDPAPPPSGQVNRRKG